MFEYLITNTTPPEDRKRIETLNSLVAAALKKSNPTKPKDVCRDMSLCFNDGQRIRHHRSLAKAWVATYQKATNTLLYNNKHYTSLSKFALDHIRTEVPDRASVDGWLVCEVEVSPDNWVSTKSLQPMNVLTL